MKNLPEHTPRANSWEHILGENNFDSQYRRLIADLPTYTPKATSWDKINAALDKKQVVSPWFYWAAASAVIGLLLGVGILEQDFEKTQDKALSSVDLKKAEQAIVPKQTEESTIARVLETSPAVAQKRKTERKINEAIEIQRIALPDVKLSPDETLSLELPKTPPTESAPLQTLHQVSISWSKIKPGLQVKTSFGRMESELGQKPQASAHHVGQLTVEIDN